MESVHGSEKDHERQEPNKLEIHVVYNGLTKSLMLERHMRIEAAVQLAAHLFGVTTNVHTLALYKEDGTEIPVTQSVAEAGIKNGDLLALRPSAVRGG